MELILRNKDGGSVTVTLNPRPPPEPLPQFYRVSLLNAQTCLGYGPWHTSPPVPASLTTTRVKRWRSRRCTAAHTSRGCTPNKQQPFACTYLGDGVCVALGVRPERLSGFPEVVKLDQAVLAGGAETAVVAQLAPTAAERKYKKGAPRQPTTEGTDRPLERGEGSR